MEKTDDIAGAIFQSKSDISGELVPGLIRKNYSGLLNQEYCSCPICGKRLKAWNKKVKRTIESLGGCLDLYRPYFYCKHCHGGFYPSDEDSGPAPSSKQDEIEQKVNELSDGKFRRPVMMIAIDGAHAPAGPEPSPWKGKQGKGE